MTEILFGTRPDVWLAWLVAGLALIGGFVVLAGLIHGLGRLLTHAQETGPPPLEDRRRRLELIVRNEARR